MRSRRGIGGYKRDLTPSLPLGVPVGALLP